MFLPHLVVKYTTSLPLSKQCGDRKGRASQKRNGEIHSSTQGLVDRAVVARWIEKTIKGHHLLSTRKEIKLDPTLQKINF